MAWRKWLVRGLVFAVAGAVLLAALCYEAWTNPSAVRRAVLTKLTQHFIGATVAVESARLRLLGGIAVHDLRMARRDDLDRGDFLYVPSGVIYHDKEHLLQGVLNIRKIELDRPRVRLVRQPDGSFNLKGDLLCPPRLDEFIPILIIRQGTILIEDRAAPAGSPLVEIKDVYLTAINDPVLTVTIEGTGQTDVLGTVHFRARFHRATLALSGSVELNQVPVAPPLIHRLASYCPTAAAHLRQLSGTGEVHALLAHQPGAVEPWTYDVACRLSGGEWRHACLPVPLEKVEASLHCKNGQVPEARLTAQSGPAKVAVTLKDLAWPGHPPSCIEEAVNELDARVEHVVVTPEFFEHLPDACRELNDLYSPHGPVSIAYGFRRTGSEPARPHWDKHWEIRPEGMHGRFKHFAYPVEGVIGSVVMDTGTDRDCHVQVDLAGSASGRLLTVKGEIHGEKSTSGVDLVVAADSVPIDDPLIRALPAKSRDLARTFLPLQSRELGLEAQPLGRTQPVGLADIKVFVRRTRGQEKFANQYVLSFHDAELCYDQFPYPLEKVTGVLDIQPDHWECHNFHGTHKGGEIFVEARSCPVHPSLESSVPPESRGTPPPDAAAGPYVQVAISGRGIRMDKEFDHALGPPDLPGRAALRRAWDMLAVQGRLNFDAKVIDRPDHPQDINVGVNIQGCTLQPEFFRYAMTDVSGGVRYSHGRVSVSEVRARHADSTLVLQSGLIELKPRGGFRAWFEGIRGNQIVPDEEFLHALHPMLRKGLEPLHLCQPLDVQTRLILDAPPEPGQPSRIWWDGGAQLSRAVFTTGIEVKDVDGAIACHGYHNGHQFEGVSGYAMLERATMLGQPFTNLQVRIEIAPEEPDVLRLYDLKGDLFGGTLGGEGRFKFGPSLSYEVKLDALRVQLDQFGRHNKVGQDSQLEGPVRASLYLKGEGTDLSGLRGDGRVEVANGKMYRLPLLLDLIKALGLRLPDRTAFEQARMLFRIEGPTMRIQQLDLFGNAISLRGQGSIGLDGSNVNLDFNADWGRMPQKLPPGISDISQALSDQLFKIKVRGTIGAPKFEKELIPSFVDPLKKAFGNSS
jgi:hypothetical protein